jgi:uncharacterized protein (TIGR03118 family)
MTKRSLLIPLVLASSTLLPLVSQAQKYQKTDLVANAADAGAKFVDPKLIDPWGIARSSSGPWWVNDRGSGVATLYDGEGKAQPLVVTIPHQVQTPPLAGPTGIVFNGSSDFDVEPGKPALFVFASLDGTISGWNPKANPTVAIEKVKATPGSVVTGATIAQAGPNRFLYVSDVGEGKIRVFDKNFRPVTTAPGAFEDDHLPKNFVPFNVQNIGDALYVAYAERNQAKKFVNFGAGLGAIDVFNPDGVLLQRLERGPWLNAPWGLVMASTDFGAFSHSVLVGQFGSGEILAFDALTGRFQDKLRRQDNSVISIPGLWAITFGAGNSNSGAPNQLFFDAGNDKGGGGVFGFLAPVAADLTQGNDQ